MKETKNTFEDIIRNRLENYTQPVDDNSWDEIEQFLEKGKKRKTLWPWITGIATIASVILLLLILPFYKNPGNYDTRNHHLSGNEERSESDLFEEEVTEFTLNSDNESEKLPVVQKNKKKESFGSSLSYNTVIVSSDTIISEEKEEKIINLEEERPVTEPEKKQSQILYNHSDFAEAPIFTKNSKKNNQSLNLSFASGRGLLAFNNNSNFQNDLSTTPPEYNFGESNSGGDFSNGTSIAPNAPESIFKELYNYEDFADVTHYAPLSFGLTFRKNLNNTFALESGLVYTFLSTKFNNPLPKREALLQLHYLGVPLNLHTRLYGNRHSNWEVYVSTGGMVEKGLLSHYTQKSFANNNEPRKLTSDDKIDGLQWSVNAAVGVDYKLYKNYSIYLEPKIGYYFDNKQPVSARTEHPFSFGISAGFRYSW